MPKKWKINCPNAEAHVGYEKFLIALELSGKYVNKIWAHCDDDNCRRWFCIMIGARGGVTVTKMPKKYHLDLTKLPIVSDIQD
jgi:hypothetical protein